MLSRDIRTASAPFAESGTVAVGVFNRIYGHSTDTRCRARFLAGFQDLTEQRLLQEEDPSFSRFTALGDFSFGFERSGILVREPPQETSVSGPRSAEYQVLEVQNKAVSFLFRRSLGDRF